MEMEALRLQNDALKAENARLKETRAAIYKLYLEAEGKSGLHHPFTRERERDGRERDVSATEKKM